MNDSEFQRQSAAIAQIVDDTYALGFKMASEPKVGALLATLAASKPGGRFLENRYRNWPRHRVATLRHGRVVDA